MGKITNDLTTSDEPAIEKSRSNKDFRRFVGRIWNHVKRGRRPYWLLLWSLLSCVAILDFPQGGYRVDFDVYRTGAQVLLAGGDIYGKLPPLEIGIGLPFTYPPIAAALFIPFAFFPLPVASALFTTISVACLLSIVRRILVLSARAGRYPFEVALLVAALAVNLGPIKETLEYGQVNLILCWLIVTGTLSLRQGKWTGGLLVGAAIAIKLTPVVFIGFFFLKRDWRNFASAILGTLALTALGFIIMPAASLQYWTKTLLDSERVGGLAYASNQSINGIVYRAGFDSAQAKTIWFIASLVVGLLLVWLALRLITISKDAQAVMVFAFLALLCSPVSWGHHWVWVVPAIVLLIFDQQSRFGYAWAMIGIIVFRLMPHWRMPNEDQKELDWSPVQVAVGNSYMIWAVGYLAILLGLSFARETKSPTHTTEVAI